MKNRAWTKIFVESTDTKKFSWRLDKSHISFSCMIALRFPLIKIIVPECSLIKVNFISSCWQNKIMNDTHVNKKYDKGFQDFSNVSGCVGPDFIVRVVREKRGLLLA